jgi:large subunit ribosomal protein L35
MNVVPDVLPSLHPSFELRVSFPQWNQTLKHPTHQAVDPGVFLTPKDVCKYVLLLGV